MVMATNKTADSHGAKAMATSPTEFHSLGEPTLNLLVLLLHVEILDGSPLPEKFLTYLIVMIQALNAEKSRIR